MTKPNLNTVLEIAITTLLGVAIGLLWNPLKPDLPQGPHSVHDQAQVTQNTFFFPNGSSETTKSKSINRSDSKPKERSEEIQKILEVLNKNPNGKEISIFFKDYFQTQHDFSSESYRARFEGLFKNPQEALPRIKAGLDSIPLRGFPIERISLLEQLEKLSQDPKFKNQCFDVVSRELSSNIVPARPDPKEAKTQKELDAALSTHFEMAVPLTAHQIAMKSAESSQTALDLTLQSLTLQQDWGIRDHLVDNFNQFYPKLLPSLLQRAKENGITVRKELEREK